MLLGCLEFRTGRALWPCLHLLRCSSQRAFFRKTKHEQSLTLLRTNPDKGSEASPHRGWPGRPHTEQISSVIADHNLSQDCWSLYKNLSTFCPNQQLSGQTFCSRYEQLRLPEQKGALTQLMPWISCNTHRKLKQPLRRHMTPARDVNSASHFK